MGTVFTVDQSHPSGPSLQSVGAVLARSGVAVFPTDTVYGIAQAVEANPEGARALFAIKRRDPSKAIPWLVADEAALDEYGLEVPSYARALAREFWPGGLTLVVSASPAVPAPFRGPGETVALRMPDSPLVCALAREAGSPLATTSANTSGLPAPTSFAEVERRIIDESDVAVDGGSTRIGLSSTVVICTGPHPTIARHGAVSDEDVMRVATEGGAFCCG